MGDRGLGTAGSTIVVSVLDNDYDPDGDLLTIIDQQVLTPEVGGELVCDAVECRYKSEADWDGAPFRFNYTVSDGRGGTARAEVEVTFP